MAQLLIDLVNGAVIVQSIVPAAYVATQQGTTTPAQCDFSNAEETLNAIVQVGAYSASNTTVYVQIEEATASGGPWTVISGMSGSVSTTNQRGIVYRGIRQKQYARANAVTVTGGASVSVTLGVTLISQKKVVGTSSGVDRSPST